MASLSWSGSMFEYLMPLLVMPTYDNTLLDQTCKAVVERQIEYGKQRGVPWGISESCYNATDTRRLPVPRVRRAGPGIQARPGRRSGDRTLRLGAGADGHAEESCANLQRLVAEGIEGRYGFYEAIDYTAARYLGAILARSCAPSWRTTSG
jgi:cyclic beta-1,2-glucan synthetase